MMKPMNSSRNAHLCQAVTVHVRVLSHGCQGQQVERVQRLTAIGRIFEQVLLHRFGQCADRPRSRPHWSSPYRSEAWANSRRSLLKYSIKIAISINTPPTNVYRKNLIAAYSRRGPPQTPIRKYIGNSMTSQNTKNRKKSSEGKRPALPFPGSETGCNRP